MDGGVTKKKSFWNPQVEKPPGTNSIKEKGRREKEEEEEEEEEEQEEEQQQQRGMTKKYYDNYF